MESFGEVDPFITSRITRFKADLAIMEVAPVIQKYITMGDCYLLDRDQHFGLVSDVANRFSVHPTSIILVGSAKLGFSIAERKRYYPFRDNSDIDVAIVSSELFDLFWQATFDYWNDSGNVDYSWPGQRDFQKYLFRGWIRPDMLPPSINFTLRKEWWEYFIALTSSRRFGPYKINGGIYKSNHFFEKYQGICVSQCKDELGEKV